MRIKEDNVGAQSKERGWGRDRIRCRIVTRCRRTSAAQLHPDLEPDLHLWALMSSFTGGLCPLLKNKKKGGVECWGVTGTGDWAPIPLFLISASKKTWRYVISDAFACVISDSRHGGWDIVCVRVCVRVSCLSALQLNELAPECARSSSICLRGNDPKENKTMSCIHITGKMWLLQLGTGTRNWNDIVLVLGCLFFILDSCGGALHE